MDIQQKALRRRNWRAFRAWPRFPAPGTASTGPHACFACRKTWKRPALPGQACPECGGPLHAMGRDFKAPRRQDRRGWKAVAAAFLRGRRFGKAPYPCGGPLTGPADAGRSSRRAATH